MPKAQFFVDFVRRQYKKSNFSLPLFILPGGPGANSTHYISYRCLQDYLDLVFFDPRGCGLSSVNDSIHYSLDNYIDDIEGIRRSLKLQKIALLGKSYSGLCALGYALRYPEAVGKLILVSTGPNYHFIATAKKKLSQIGNEAQIYASKKLWEGQFRSSNEVEDYFNLMTPLYSTRASLLLSDQKQKILPYAYEPLNRGFLVDLRSVDFEKKLNKIACQTLVITGDSDWIFDQKYSKLMVEKIPNTKLVIFKNAGHFIEDDVGNEYYREVRNFIL